MLGNILIYLLRRSGPFWVALYVVLWIVGVSNSWFEITYTDAHVVIDRGDFVKVKYDKDSKSLYFKYPYIYDDEVEEIRNNGTYTSANIVAICAMTILGSFAFCMLCVFFGHIFSMLDEKDARGKAWLTYYVLKWRGLNPDRPNDSRIIVIMTLDMSYSGIAQYLTKTKKS